MYLLSLESMTEVLIWICYACEVDHKWHIKLLPSLDSNNNHCLKVKTIEKNLMSEEELNQALSTDELKDVAGGSWIISGNVSKKVILNGVRYVMLAPQ